ncbi:MAG: formyltetrahydrofolate deformylase [Actinomycetota bacterium]|nr:formyltetrahydrofolate deformylase [Actinomycetota bacterium]
MRRYVLTIRCQDQPGIVLATAQAIVEAEGNIVESDQFSDPATGLFCMRTCFDSGRDPAEMLSSNLARFDAAIGLRPLDRRHRILVMASKLDHCLADLLYRHQLGELPVEIPLVTSNHPDLEPLAARHGIPFVQLEATPANREEAGRELAALIEENAIDDVVLARYMQILSPEVCERYPGRIINIHHSFLPGFKGAKPYHQAYAHGVKLIGATAHYVTAELDEGPIIAQDVEPVTHATGPEELIAIGRDIERSVLARAVRLHAEDRVVLAGRRTIVFAP